MELFNTLATRDVDVFADLRTALSERSIGHWGLTASIGFGPFRLKRLLRCAERLFGTIEGGVDIESRDKTVAVTRELKLSLSTTVQINRRPGQLNNVEIREYYRLNLTRVTAAYDFEELDTYMRVRVKKLNHVDELSQHLRAHISQNPDVRGMKHLQVTGPANTIDDPIAPLTVRATEIAKAHEDCIRDRCISQALAEHLTYGSEGPLGDVDKLRYQPAPIVAVQDIVEYSPRFVATSNSSAFTPGQFVEALLMDTGWMLACDEHNTSTDLLPIHNPCLATEEQHIAVILDNLICVWPGCPRPAHAGQAHHLVTRRNRGTTTMESMAMIRKEHNATNDDDRQGLNGHLEHDDDSGTVYRNPPSPHVPPEFNLVFPTALAGRACSGYRQCEQLYRYTHRGYILGYG